ncbi:hypothetical protein HMPREF9278_1903 [Mobiluncus mulieris FB024-16]|nr:hypothetical protein HMPREF9278_1903 [Mobiluncus mulieris FB024-16]
MLISAPFKTVNTLYSGNPRSGKSTFCWLWTLRGVAVVRSLRFYCRFMRCWPGFRQAPHET